jgi:hypothetical protein
MDLKTEQVLKLFRSHLRIKNFLTILCYLLIIGGIFIYVFYAFNRSHTIKLIKKYKDNAKEYQTEKIMTNPRIKFQYNDKQIYYIKAREALHENDQEVILYDVFASGEIGNITAGKLKIDEEGDHLVFSQNPVLILNKTTNTNSHF